MLRIMFTLAGCLLLLTKALLFELIRGNYEKKKNRLNLDLKTRKKEWDRSVH